VDSKSDEREDIVKESAVKEISCESERASKSLSIRMPAKTFAMVDRAVAMYESDRTEVIKRAVRLLNACLSGHNSCILITDRDGVTKEITMMIKGVPT